MLDSDGGFTRDFLKPAVLWALKIVIAALFLIAGIAKLAGAPQLVAEFAQIGFGQWFRYLTALIEIAGALLLLWPAFAALGALLLVGINIGALLAQIFALHGDVVHPIVLGALTALLAWTHRRRAWRSFHRSIAPIDR